MTQENAPWNHASVARLAAVQALYEIEVAEALSVHEQIEPTGGLVHVDTDHEDERRRFTLELRRYGCGQFGSRSAHFYQRNATQERPRLLK